MNHPALRWLLVVSLALNLAVIAGIAWHHLGDGEHRRARMHAMHAPMPNPMLLRRVLSEERQAVVDATLDAHRPRIRASVRAVIAARREAHALMTAETLDPQALDAAFETLRQRDAEAAAAVQAMLTDLLPKLTPEERQKLGEAMHRPRHRR